MGKFFVSAGIGLVSGVISFFLSVAFLCFALLLAGILSHIRPDMTLTYKVAAPVAVHVRFAEPEIRSSKHAAEKPVPVDADIPWARPVNADIGTCEDTFDDRSTGPLADRPHQRHSGWPLFNRRG